MQLEEKQLIKIVGGSISATTINAVAKIFVFILELGRTIGTVIRRSTTGQTCQM